MGIRSTLILLLIASLLCAGNFSPIATVYIVDLQFWGEKREQPKLLEGIYPDIFRELSKRTNIPMKQVLAPYPRVIKGLEEGSSDFTISLPKEFADSTIILGDPVWSIKLGVLSLKSNPITSIEQMQGMRIGTIRNAAFTPEFRQDTTIRKVPSNQHTNLMKMLIMGRIDGIASDLSIMRGVLETDSTIVANFAEPLQVTELKLHFLMHYKSPYKDHFDLLNSTLQEMKADGTIRDIVLRYLK